MGQSLSFALLILLSGPVLLDWADHILRYSWTWYVIPFVFLTPLAVHGSASRGRPRTSLALCLAAAGFSIQLWAIASGVTRFGRPGFVLCVVGVLLLYGNARSRNLMLLALCVPMPDFLLDRVGRIGLPTMASVIASAERLFGMRAAAIGSKIEFPEHAIHLHPTDLGLTTALLAFGLSWYACLVLELSLRRSALVCAMAGIFGMTIHWTATAVSFASPSFDASGRMPRDLTVYVTIVIASALAWAGWRASRGAADTAATTQRGRVSRRRQASSSPPGRGQD